MMISAAAKDVPDETDLTLGVDFPFSGFTDVLSSSIITPEVSASPSEVFPIFSVRMCCREAAREEGNPD